MHIIHPQIPFRLEYPLLAASAMHYMVPPHHETPGQLRQRLQDTSRGLPPVIETRNWAIHFMQFQSDCASIDHEQSRAMMISYMVKLHMLPMARMWSHIIHSICPDHRAQWQLSLFDSFGITWQRVKTILETEFRLVDPEIPTSEDEPVSPGTPSV